MDRSTGDKLSKSEIFLLLEMAAEARRTAAEIRRSTAETRRSAAKIRSTAAKLRCTAAEIRSVKICKAFQAATGLSNDSNLFVL